MVLASVKPSFTVLRAAPTFQMAARLSSEVVRPNQPPFCQGFWVTPDAAVPQLISDKASEIQKDYLQSRTPEPAFYGSHKASLASRSPSPSHQSITKRRGPSFEAGSVTARGPVQCIFGHLLVKQMLELPVVSRLTAARCSSDGRSSFLSEDLCDSTAHARRCAAPSTGDRHRPG